MARAKKWNQSDVNADLIRRFGTTVTLQQLKQYRQETGCFPVWIYRDPSCKAGRGMYRVPSPAEQQASDTTTKVRRAVSISERDDEDTSMTANAPTANAAPSFTYNDSMTTDERVQRVKELAQEASLLSIVPERCKYFVPFGDFDMVRGIVASRKFFPVLITGLSGNGKTFGVKQACAMEKREFIRVPITCETDEDDLLGGFRLVNGNTKFELGPVVVGMLRGAVVLLDEVDKNMAKIMCLQPVLEGEPLVLKKLGIVIKPQPGFQIFATANTKGRGDDTGMFTTSVVMDEAFLERIAVTVEQQYPSVQTEEKILTKVFEAEGGTVTPVERAFFNTLAKWAEAIRTTYAEGGVEAVMATRRLVHIVRAYLIFADQEMALTYCVNRFDTNVKEAFIDLYNKLAPDDVEVPKSQKK